MTAGVINSLIGTVLGNIFGIAVAKKIMLPVYLQRINIPVNGLKISWITVLVSFVVPLATSILGIYIGARKVAHILPVEAMRAGVPVVTKYMPEMKFLSAHLSKSNFIGIRNMFRSPFRTVFMILGIGLCMGLTTCLYSIFGSLDRMMLSQFTNHQKYDLKIMFDVSKDEDHITEKLESYGDIRKSELIKEKPHKLINGDNEKDVMLTVLPEKSELLAVYNDIERKEEKLSDGLILSTNLAKVLKAEVGDKIKIADILGKEYVESEVTTIVNQSYGIQCFVKESVYEDLYNNDTGFNTVLIECSDKNGLKEKLLHDNEISSFIDVKDNYDNHQTFLKSFKTMLRIFFILSAVLSSIIIFSISIVSHMDRKYEFNTMQVIGYSPNEIVKTNYIENIVELVTGVIIGLPLALFMKKIITSAFVISEEIKMPDNVEPFSYVIGLCIIMTVFIISNIVSRISIERMNLSDALKERQ
jgi:ABC-type antimicrobial peptide transport system permease subunit